MTNSLPTPRAFLTRLFRSLASIRAGDEAQNTESANPLRHLAAQDKQLFLALHVLFPNELLPALDLLDRGLVTRFVVRGASVDGNTREEKELKVSAAQDVAPKEGKEEELDPLNSIHAEEDRAQCLSSNDTTALPTNPSLQLPTSPTTTDITRTPRHSDRHSFYIVRSAQPPPTYHHRSRSRYSSAADTYSTTPSYEVRLRAWNCSCPAFAFSAFPATAGDAAFDAQTQSAHVLGERHDYSADGEEEWTFGGLMMGDGGAPACKHLLACLLAEKCGLLSRFVEEKAIGREEAAAWAAGWEA